MFGKVNKIHFIGIGGIGMSGIAEVLHNLGFEISGSDISMNKNVKRLKNLGVKVFIGHNPENVKDVDVVVYSSAIKEDNPELISAKDRHIPVIKRGEMLAELTRLKRSITVSGSHGKTTTTSMIAHIFIEAKLDPTIVIGGRLNSSGQNAVLGKGDYFICESDESDRSFLLLYPTINVVTNIDLEHLDVYQDLEDIKSAFIEYCNKIPFYGLNLLCIENQNVTDIIPSIEKRFQTYGFKKSADIRADNIIQDGYISTFDVYYFSEKLGRIHLNTPGIHNVLNSLGAIGVAIECGITFDVIKEALKNFQGVERRLSIRYKDERRVVIDDYGHHPTEIKATLQSVRSLYPDYKIVTIFQPHRYTRTKALLNEFASSFYDTDILIVTDIYAASEAPIEGVSSDILVEKIKMQGLKDVYYIADFDKIFDLEIFNDEKVVFITLGAGNITELSYKIADYFRSKENV
ncbi:UDP-N-acetylmuramate-alanine ligase [Deferribacter desulfuricans SSM1]|uniref:UDP-N-acetylmuramate--L-alanine ligase n=1 Tax=Deferribacter desulfuricans (strain DSM 14783 / JCM 11476 / NBRC 101012 / SSM1) TaxID=639282 RepID=D3PBV6_DEFDS|nr:UDP-N-acetylmuramate--L-alanine ligase [Deferribacter desulfuricans]BAI80079.1 UDP-N-acetylmuramate-alanine ligase [Deferribacter desulfuricans SSM1]